MCLAHGSDLKIMSWKMNRFFGDDLFENVASRGLGKRLPSVEHCGKTTYRVLIKVLFTLSSELKIMPQKLIGFDISLVGHREAS